MEPKQTAAEWIFEFNQKHPEVLITISTFLPSVKGIHIYIEDRSHTVNKAAISHILTSLDIQSINMSIDELLIITMETMWKEVEKLWTNS